MSRHLVCPHCAAVNRLPEERLQQPGADGAVCGKCKERLFTGAPVEVDAAGFDLHRRRSEVPVLVDFWSAVVRPVPDHGAEFRSGCWRAGAGGAAAEGEYRAGAATGRRARRSARFRRWRCTSAARKVARQAGAMDTANIVRWVQANLPR